MAAVESDPSIFSFSPKPIQIAVIGSSHATDHEIEIASQIGVLLAKNRITLLSGGRGGVMDASCEGAYFEHGLVVGIVPGDEGNQFLSVTIRTRMSHARNFILIGSADAVIAVGGEYGTLSEIGFALKMGIPVFGVETWDIKGVIRCKSADEVVKMAISSYSNCMK